MFVIRHEKNGVDTYYNAEGVRYHAPDAIEGPHGLHLLGKPDPNNDRLDYVLTGGRVFVMNESGKTIATYKLKELVDVASHGVTIDGTQPEYGAN